MFYDRYLQKAPPRYRLPSHLAISAVETAGVAKDPRDLWVQLLAARPRMMVQGARGKGEGAASPRTHQRGWLRPAALGLWVQDEMLDPVPAPAHRRIGAHGNRIEGNTFFFFSLLALKGSVQGCGVPSGISQLLLKMAKRSVASPIVHSADPPWTTPRQWGSPQGRSGRIPSQEFRTTVVLTDEEYFASLHPADSQNSPEVSKRKPFLDGYPYGKPREPEGGDAEDSAAADSDTYTAAPRSSVRVLRNHLEGFLSNMRNDLDTGLKERARVRIFNEFLDYGLETRYQNFSGKFYRDLGCVGSYYFVHEFLISSELLRDKSMFQGAIILDTILHYNDTMYSQDIPKDIQEASAMVAQEIAEDGFRGNFLASMSRWQLDGPLALAFTRAWRSQGQPHFGLHSLAVQLGPQLLESTLTDHPNFLRSDHVTFWYQNHPAYDHSLSAILLTDTGPFRGTMRECYHEVCDDITALTDLNLQFIEKTANSLVALIIDLARGSCSTGKETFNIYLLKFFVLELQKCPFECNTTRNY
ncbi:hypothetical protein HPB48_001163 [Haemaphysalis longicornis]|uniref:Uncharacterized protein n=1 Tax=Haemaphysalis longicornis TaxID=44386 RepID=A0A9J6FL42_HAELO|nr:hypothetical protein HPB48_001163 [Haemaphysalis longicornis]